MWRLKVGNLISVSQTVLKVRFVKWYYFAILTLKMLYSAYIDLQGLRIFEDKIFTYNFRLLITVLAIVSKKGILSAMGENQIQRKTAITAVLPSFLNG